MPTNKINMAELLADRAATMELIGDWSKNSERYALLRKREARFYDLEAAFILAVEALEAIVKGDRSTNIHIARNTLEKIRG